jgi:UDP-N-acetylmuramoylalanine--D-glutamate ligase
MKAGVTKLKIKDQNILVVGLGTSGISTVKTLMKLGANITIYDQKTKEELAEIIDSLYKSQLTFILGEEPKHLAFFDLIVISPGVPLDLPFLEQARFQKVPIIGELELAYRLSKGKIIAITGTNGKTTTTALIGEIFKNAAKEIFVVGNIGVAAISKALDTSENTTMITEVSSFQLESIVDFKPYISAILNITSDHLNRHKTMENYISAKANIFKNQDKKGYLILNADDELTSQLEKQAESNVIFFSRKKELDRGTFVVGEDIVVKEEGKYYKEVCKINDLKIPGKHNLENALAAVAIAFWAGIKIEVIAKTLKEFAGVEHRIEFVTEINGIRFVNDSKGTNPDASIRAIEAVQEPIILIAGGMDKGSDFDVLIRSFKGKVKHLILLGEVAAKIKETAEKNQFNNVSIVKNMEEAVEKSVSLAQIGDTVLLSPACASWDMYPDFEVRGRHFKECVEKIRRS